MPELFSITPIRTKVAYVGDSIIAVEKSYNTATDTYSPNRSPSFWARFLTGQRIVSPQSLNFGVSGDTTTAILARMTPILTSGAGVFYIAAGTNDPFTPNFIPTATTISNLQSIVQQLLAIGGLVYLQTILPRTLGTQSDRDAIYRINNWIREQASKQQDRLIIVDPFLDYGNPTATNMAPRTNYAYDGLHPTSFGAYAITQPIVAALNSIIPARGPVMALASDVWSANNPNGSLVTNGLMAGTAGTNGGGGGTISGSIADSWTLSHIPNGGTVTGLTTTASKVTLADGRPAQRLIVGGTYSGAGSAAVDAGTSIMFRQDGLANISAGDVVKMNADIAVAAGADNVSGIQAQFLMTIGGTNYTISDGACITSDYLPNVAFAGTLETPTLIVPSGTQTLVRAAIRIYLRTAAAQTPVLDMTIAGIKVHKVTN